MANFEELSRVVMEGNAFNKLVDKRELEYNKLDKIGHAYRNLANDLDDGPLKDKIRDKAYETNSRKGDVNKIYFDDKDKNGDDDVERDKYDLATRINRYKRNTNDNIIKSYSNMKKRWMENHGNKGRSPEERYKANRYLDIQKIKNSTKMESVDELKLEIYESCEYGEITKEQRDLLLANLD